MNLVWLYIWLRRLAYLLGLVGFVLMIIGKQSGEKDPWSLRIGFICIVGMTLLFLCNYALWMYLRFRKKPSQSRPHSAMIDENLDDDSGPDADSNVD